MSKNYMIVGMALAVLAGPSGAQAQASGKQGPAMQPAVKALLQECHKRQVARWEGVTHYVVDQSMMGTRATLAYQRFETAGPDGKMYPAFQPMRGGVQGGQGQPASGFTSDQLRVFGQGATMVGGGLSDEMAKAGFPAGMLGGGGGDPWTSTDPRVMMGGASTFVNAAANAQDQNVAESEMDRAEASAALGDMAEIGQRLRLVGTETVGDRRARHLQGRGLQKRVSGEDDVQMVVDDVDLWIDSEECVPLRFTLAGTMTSEGQSRPITIERIDSDYRKVAGSRMYEPYRQVMRMQGVMTPAQQGEMAQAQAQMADMEKKLAQMPPAQREMIMQQMGPQMAAMKGMASSGAFEMVTEVHTILVNPNQAAMQNLQASAGVAGVPGIPGAAGGFPMAAGMPAAAAAPAAVPMPAAQSAPVPTAQPVSTQAAQQACLQEKIKKKQVAQKKKQGMGRLLGAVGRVAGQFGGYDVAGTVNDVMTVQATADDLAAAARDLGITQSEIDACSNAQ